jgi:predicted outer membrane protein
MKHMFFSVVALSSGLALLLGANAADAQVIPRSVPAAQPQGDPPALGERVTALHDMFLANWIGIDNQTEITLNQFAMQKASSQEVKDFAQEMIRAHGELAKKLNSTVANTNTAAFPRIARTPYTAGYRGPQAPAPAAPGMAPGMTPEPPTANPPQANQGNSPQGNPTPGTPTPATTPAPVPEQPASNSPQEGAAPRATEGPVGGQPGSPATISGGPIAAAIAGSRLNPVNFKREINSQLVTIVEQKLDQKKGQEFDRCFVQGQIGAHVHMLATLEVARTQASSQLKPVLDEAVEVAQNHLRHAESLLNKLDSQESRSANSRNDQPSTR